MGLKETMLQRNQKLIDQFNRDEQLWHRLQWRKVKRRVRLPKLGALSHAILDLRDEMRERRRPADCIGRKRMEPGPPDGRQASITNEFVPDPLGEPIEAYEASARIIDNCVKGVHAYLDTIFRNE